MSFNYADDLAALREEHDSLMRAEAIGSPNDWAEDERPTDEGRPWSREQWMETGNGYY